ncbi:MAG: lamin tail domain-containing protein, partial [Bacteroidales bacterium]|nr:lamin tail domain-containing protein [Bacteroidales bacterium]
MKVKYIILTACLLVLPRLLGAQNVSDLIIAEIMAQPDSTGLLDDYGRRSGWIELYNTSTGTVSYGGCFLTDDRNNLKKSLIPPTDLRTKLGPRQSVVFFASGNGHDGTFYAGFTLRPGSTVYLVSNDGRTIVDSLAIPAQLTAGKSVVKKAIDLREKVFEAQADAAVPTPGAPNKDPNSESKAQKMSRLDPHGFILAITSISVVFFALAILWGLFNSLFSPKKPKAPKDSKASKVKKAPAGALSPEV